MIKRLLPILLAVMFALLPLCACGGGGGEDGPSPTEAAPDLNVRQLDRINDLAKAFYLFGPMDSEEGVPFAKIEEMIACMYCEGLGESDIEGYGRIPVEKADKMIAGVFEGAKIPDLLRTKYDPEQDQEFFLLDDYYYVKQRDTGITRVALKSYALILDSNGKDTGVSAKVNVDSANGKKTLVLKLAYADQDEFSVISCEEFMGD